MVTAKKRDLVGSLCCIAVGGLFSLGSLKYGDLRAGFPSPVLFPFVGGIILIGLSLTEFVDAVRRKEKGEENGTFFPEIDSWRRLLIAICVMVVYALVVEILGFLMTTFFFMFVLLRFVASETWKKTLITALLTAAVSYVLFEVLLKVELPTGVLGI